VRLRLAYKRSALHLTGLVIVAAVVAVTIVRGGQWWRDRPLATVARFLEEPGEADRALEAAEAFLARHPAHDRGRALKARALAELGRWDEASQIFSEVGANSPEESRAWATALVHQRRFSEALVMLERLLQLQPDDPVVLRHVTTCRFQMGLIPGALESASRLARIDGHTIEGLFLVGVIHRAQGDVHLALENWERLESVLPNAEGLPISAAEFFLVFGEDLLSEGLPRAASIKLRKSRDLEDRLVVQLRLGQACAISGNVAEAAEAWKRALEHDAGNVEARLGLAELAMDRSDGEKGLEWLTPLASRPDVSSETAYLLERIHTFLGNEGELEDWQRRTAELRESERREAVLNRKLRRGL
jgi:tetratricopeptide (TPR) repeat protein